MASTTMGAELDLSKIALELPGSEYEPDRFPGLIYRIRQPKTAVLLFRSGKAVCTGGRSWNQADAAVRLVADRIRKGKQKALAHPVLQIQNIVATADLETEINLNFAAVTLGLDRVEYEPEQFPGLVCRLDDPRVVVLLFGSGKLVCTGARRPLDVGLGIAKITEELRKAGLLGRPRSPVPAVAKSKARRSPSVVHPVSARPEAPNVTAEA